jgi:hypothetical protein
MAQYTFEHLVGGQPRSLTVEHQPLTDRLTVAMNGVQVPVTLHRRPFSSLWRYAFSIDHEALEVRVQPDGLRGISVSLHASGAPVEKKALSMSALIGIAVGALVISSMVLPGPLEVRVVIGLFAGLGTAAILGLVSRRV